MQNFDIKVITIEKNVKLQESLTGQASLFGIRNLEFKFGKPVCRQNSIGTIANIIFKDHENIIKHFLSQNNDKDLMICEDDVDFMEKENFFHIIDIHNNLLKLNRTWTVLIVGHVMLLPGVPSGVDGTLFSPLSFAAHCYIINRNAKYLLDLPSSSFNRPHLIEGWQALPLHQRLACFPSLATQRGPLPKELRSILFVKDIPFEIAMKCTNILVHVVAVALVVLVLWLVSKIQ